MIAVLVVLVSHLKLAEFTSSFLRKLFETFVPALLSFFNVWAEIEMQSLSQSTTLRLHGGCSATSSFRICYAFFVLLAVVVATSAGLMADDGFHKKSLLDIYPSNSTKIHLPGGWTALDEGATQVQEKELRRGESRTSIAAELRSRPDLSAMNQSLSETELAEQFQLEGMAATLFVPPTELLQSATKVHSDSSALEDLMKYHIVYGKLTDDWFEKGETVVTQRKVDNASSEVRVSLDDAGVRRVNGLPILRTIEAINGRICFVGGILDLPSAAPAEPPSFSKLLRSRKGYRMMAEVMESQTVRQALSNGQTFTVFAAPDRTLSNIEGGSKGRAVYALEQLIVPGRNTSDRLEKQSTKWLLPLNDGGPTRGWAIRSKPSEAGFKLFQIGPEGLPANEIAIVAKDIEATDGLIHLLEDIPGTPSMTRGGLLEQGQCREILASALERCEIRKSRGELDSAIAILKSAHEGQAAATYDTAAICKSYIEANLDDDEFPDVVPAHVFTILNAGFIRGLSMDATARDEILQSYQTAIELAKSMLEPSTLAGTSQNSALKGLPDRLDSYRSAVDLGRFTLRLQGLPDKAWLGDRDLFSER